MENIVVRMPNWIGDLVMATAALSDLRIAFPEASITAMCRAPLSELLEHDTAVNEIFSFTRPTNGFERREERRNIVSKLAAGKFDLGILLTNSFSSAWLFWQGNVRRRIGYGGHLRDWLLTDPVAWPKEKRHQVDLYKHLLRPLGINHSRTMPRLFVSSKQVEEAKQLLIQRGYRQGKPLVGINPGAAYGSAKCWPPERFRALAEKLLRDNHDLSLVFLGDGSHKALIQEISTGLPPDRAFNLAGVTSLKELVAIISDLDLLVTNDSGPMHIAAALDIPLVALFGSTDDEVTGPFGKPEAVIHKHVSCSPCLKRVCPIDFRCMKNITVEEVKEAIQIQLRKVRV